MTFTQSESKCGRPGAAGDWRVATLLFLAAAAVYLFSAPPWFLFDDNPEFIAGAFRLGVVHPPGYPLFMALGKLMSRVPLPNVAFAINSVSALAGALAAPAFYGVGRALGWRREAAAMGALCLAFSRMFWRESLEAEVYALNALFCLLGLYAWVRLNKAGGARWAAATVALAGLAVVNHYSAALIFGPLLLSALLSPDARRACGAAGLAAGLLAAAAAGALWIYLPLRGAAGPAVNWTPIETPAALLGHLKGVNLGGEFLAAEKWKLFKAFLSQAGAQFSPGLLLLAAPGLWAMAKGRRSGLPAFLWIVLAATAVGGILLPIHYAYSSLAVYVLSYFYIPAYLTLALAIACGADWIFGVSPQKLRPLAAALALGWTLAQIPINAETSNLNRSRLAWDYGRSIIQTPATAARVFLAGETEMFPALCLREAFGMRPDLTLYGVQGKEAERFLPSGDGETDPTGAAARMMAFEKALAHDAAEIPTYMSVRRLTQSSFGFESVQDGLLYRLRPETGGEEAPEPGDPMKDFALFKKEPAPDYAKGLDYLTRRVVDNIHLKRAEADLQAGRIDEARSRLDKLERFAPDSRRVQMAAGNLFFSMGDLESAKRAFERALELPPDDLKEGLEKLSLHNNLAAIFRAQNEPERAIEHALKAAELAPDFAAVQYNLANLYFETGKCTLSAERYKRTVKLGLETAEILNKLAICLEKTGNDVEAHAAYQKAIRKDPSFAPAYKDFGIFMAMRQGNLRAAAAMWKRYLELAPDAPDREDTLYEIRRLEKMISEDTAPIKEDESPLQ